MDISSKFLSLNALLRWARKHARKRSDRSSFIKATFAATIYFLWLARNTKIFEAHPPNARDVVHRIATNVYRALYAAN